MLTSSANQYLRPEYLTPLPTTLDAKKSPLALLAQTCSQIGADSPSNKSLLGSLDKASSNKSSKSDQSREKSSPTVAPSSLESTKTNFKPYESCLAREKASTPDEQRSASSHSASGRSRTPGSGNKRCPSNQSVSSVRAVTPQGRKTATPNGDVARESPASRTSATGNLSSNQLEPTCSSSQPAVVSSPSLQAKPSYSPASVLAITDPSIKDLPLGTFKPGVSLASSTAAYLTYAPQLPIDAMASTLVSQHHASLKNGLIAGNPYLSYARLKSSSAPDTLMPVCRDPYCTGCQLNSHLFANGKLASTTTSTPTSCPAGCAQCDHKPAVAYGALGAAAYAHAQLAALAAASQLPYVCNWIAGDTAYCGKRFSTSEELLQHLRSHTTSSTSAATDPSAAALSLLSPSVGLPPTHPLFSRTYPTPPLSPLATARYHPYGKSSTLLPPSLSSLGLPLPPPHSHTPAGLPPYFSPYSLYGAPRLGAASGLPQ
ncbi:zinc finger protein Elbow isoform X1 [Osmia lignaria lignaria]|uniref:zinc finger protein Elbow isoform X1 n=1 Tax=Osmia lignaria lignaria TaxID=1437193 RepID=UPI0014780F77|nr:zinc finger protein Elbow isoform X1 [Osmia lignaria]